MAARLEADAIHFQATALFFHTGGGTPKDERHRRELVRYFWRVSDERFKRAQILRGLL